MLTKQAGSESIWQMCLMATILIFSIGPLRTTHFLSLCPNLKNFEIHFSLLYILKALLPRKSVSDDQVVATAFE